MRSVVLTVLVTVLASPLLVAQASPSEQVQVGPPPVRRADPPSPGANTDDLENRGDGLRLEKDYLDALDYYRAALAKKRNDPVLLNKSGIAELMMQRYKEAGKDFDRSIKANRDYAEAYNNRGVIYYEEKNYGKAINHYQKAIKLQPESASYYSNLGAAYFARKEFEKASDAYTQALQLDPDIFDRVSRAGVSAQLSSPEDRAHFDFVIARLYAKAGDLDRSLQSLKRAMEEGYKGIEDVYKEQEFTALRKDPRFAQLMTDRPPAIPE